MRGADSAVEAFGNSGPALDSPAIHLIGDTCSTMAPHLYGHRCGMISAAPVLPY